MKTFTWIIDAHNVTFDYLLSPQHFIRFIAKTCISNADYVIVTNEGLKSELSPFTDKIVILPDKLPDFELAHHSSEQVSISLTRPLITLISTFAVDEPIETFIKAAAQIDRPFTLYITGKLSKAESLLRYASHKIVFTDFLPQEEYDNLLKQSDLVVDLTSRENCLVCGAYEALALNRPMILSNTACLKQTFGVAAIYSDNNIDGFRQALITFLENPGHYRSLVTTQRLAFTEKWNKCFKSANELMERNSE